MGSIRVLPENVINKIAAGEVVERPSSVVKELVENSLDAGARTITVTVKHGGKELIRVADDGEGMSADDANNALKRYATSKLSSVEDIFRVQSFGFRGEALPSIAAVSRLTLLTRKKEAGAGTELRVEGGELRSVKETGSSPGTTVEARHLFFNTPARRKFLRSDRAEYLAVMETLTTFALGNPSVHFRLFNDGKVALDCPASKGLRDRVEQLYDQEMMGVLIPLDAKSNDVSVVGFVTNPTVSRVNRTGQHFFINNRPIKSPALSFALQQGYENLLPPKRHCLAFLFLDIALSRVDVNVHPHKKEVRVANERQVQKLLVDVLRAALHSQQTFPRALPSSSLPADFLTRKGKSQGTGASRPYQAPSSSTPLLREPPANIVTGSDRGSLAQPASLRRLSFCREESGSVPCVIGQYEASYILAGNEGTLLIIDQHAAHERVLYERVLEMFGNSRALSQRQLIPVTFSLDYREQEVLEQYLPDLEHLGFGINDLGRNTYSIDAAPAVFATEEPKQLVLDFIHEMMEWQQSRAVEDRRNTIAAAIACKRKTVKAATRLTPEAMEQLVNDLFQTKQPFQCPHGRPTCITLTLSDLEKQFGRR